tara:strand:- start:2028 stop:2183 length:156 start_codon:yes stop_codon:yes gene_type:complete
MTFLTIILSIVFFIFGLIIGFFLSFYFIIKRKLKDKENGVQPTDVDNLYDL